MIVSYIGRSQYTKELRKLKFRYASIIEALRLSFSTKSFTREQDGGCRNKTMH